PRPRGRFPPSEAGPGPRTLSRRSLSQARSACRIEAAGAEAASWFVAPEFRPDLGSADRTARKTKRHQTDDRAAQAIPEARSLQVASGDRIRTGRKLLRCGGDSAPAKRRGAAACVM